MASKTILVIVKKAIKAMENIVKVSKYQSKYIVIQFCIQKISFRGGNRMRLVLLENYQAKYWNNNK